MVAGVISVVSAVAGAMLQAPAVPGLPTLRSHERPASDSGLELGGQPDRYVFMAGLEGTGHHYFRSVFKDCVRKGLCGMRHNEFYESLQDDSDSAPRIERQWTTDAPRDGRLYPLNTVYLHHRVFMMSYPNGRREPNLATYAEVAKSVGDDLKVVVMLRKASDLLQSDMSRWSHGEDVLLSAGEAMLQQLTGLDKSKVVCMWFDSFGLPDSGSALSHFLGVDAPSAKRGAFNLSQSMASHFTMPSRSCHDGGWLSVAKRGNALRSFKCALCERYATAAAGGDDGAAACGLHT